MAIVNEKLLNAKLFRKLKVETHIWDHNDKVCSIEIRFPERGPASKISKKEVEPLRKQIESALRSWQRVIK
jgi:hypothetical protein